MFYLYAYRVTASDAAQTPNNIWHGSWPHNFRSKPVKDPLDWQDGQWMDLPDLGVRALRMSAPLADVMVEGGMERMISNLQGKLAGAGIELHKFGQT